MPTLLVHSCGGSGAQFTRSGPGGVRVRVAAGQDGILFLWRVQRGDENNTKFLLLSGSSLPAPTFDLRPSPWRRTARPAWRSCLSGCSWC